LLIDGLIDCSAIGINGPNQGFKIVWKCGLKGMCGKLEALARENKMNMIMTQSTRKQEKRVDFDDGVAG